MSTILYYSNFCENSKNLLSHISKSTVKNQMHFICIDNRVQEDGKINIVFPNGDKVILPPSVDKVPALLLLNRGGRVLFGNDILSMLSIEITARQQEAVNNNGEPLAFSINDVGSYGVASDNFSFLDQDADELSAKGNGGMRQSHHYASLNGTNIIETPPDTYTSDKIGNVSMEHLQQKRQQEIQK